MLARAGAATGRSRAWVDGRMAPLAALVEAGRRPGRHPRPARSAVTPGPGRPAAAPWTLSPASTSARWSAPRRGWRRARSAAGRHSAATSTQRAREADVLRHQLRRDRRRRGIEDPDEETHLAAEEERLADLGATASGGRRRLAALGRRRSRRPGALDCSLGGRRAWAAARPFAAGREPPAGRPGRAGRRGQRPPAASSRPGRTTRAPGRGPGPPPAAGRPASQVRGRPWPRWWPSPGDGPGRAWTSSRAPSGRPRRLEAERAERPRPRSGAAERRSAGSAQAAAPRWPRRSRPACGDAGHGRGPLRGGRGRRGAGDEVTLRCSGPTPASRSSRWPRWRRAASWPGPCWPCGWWPSGGPATMVFDEVDAGVGGTAALALAGALREVAERPPGAGGDPPGPGGGVRRPPDRGAQGRRRRADGDRGRAARRPTSDRVVELSRMLSGHPDSATARAHAEELLASAPRRPGGAVHHRRPAPLRVACEGAPANDRSGPV